MEEILRVLPNETEDECLFRIGEAKRDGLLDLTWTQIADFFNRTFRENDTEYRTESSYRKKFKNYIDAKDMLVKSKFTESGFDEQYNELKSTIRELQKEKIKIRDERIDYQKSIREDARRESFIELVQRAFAANVEPFDYRSSSIIDSDEDMIVCLSDLHAGIEVQNWWNTYNISVLKNRLYNYLNEILMIQKLHKCKVCDVVLGGDMISGWIHKNLRLQNNENVIEQVKIAVTYIADFIYELQPYFEQINVYSVSGNHSRLSPNKDEQLKGEELDALIPFCLNIKFENNDSVNICEDSMIDNTIGCMKTRSGKMFYLIHGDKDTPSNVVQKLTLMTGTKPDGIIMGHRHHNALNTEHGVKIIQCGCVVGIDDYCVDKRISGEPEQCVFITSENRTVKCLYDIGLN